MLILDDFQQRGLVAQTTAFDELAAHLDSPGRLIYCGFDPTARSLTVGNLLPLVTLRRLLQAGHTPVVIMGGATGLIGDPTGKTAERELLDRDRIAENMANQRTTVEQLLDVDARTGNGAILLDNSDWLQSMTFIDALRGIGKHFSVNAMLKTDSVKSRLEREQGLSFTEFAYPLLQAWDFAWLYRNYGVTVQLGGADQWANILAGVDLTRRLHGETVYGLTSPLIMTAAGKKFGKTEEGAVWLDPGLTPPFAFHQFWINLSDADVGSFLRLFTLLSLSEIALIEAEHQLQPERRGAQLLLAQEMTRLVHGQTNAVEAGRAAAVLFGQGSLVDLSHRELLMAMSTVPVANLAATELPTDGLAIVDVLCRAEICTSKRESRELLAAGAIQLNGKRVFPQDRLTHSQLLYGEIAAVRRGKKTWKFLTWSQDK